MPRPVSAEKRRSSATPLYLILGAVALAGIGLVATQLKPAKAAGASDFVPVTLTPEQLQRVPGISVGRSDAPIAIYEFADYQCPACGQWATFIEPVIKERLVDTGKARYVFYDFPLGGTHQYAFLAARAGRCANEQNKFWEFHDALFARQRDWSYAKNIGDAAEKFSEYAETAGVDDGAFEQCLASDKYAKEVSETRKLGETLGVQGTPTIFVNGQRITDLPGSYSEFEAQVRRIAPQAFGDAPVAEAPAAGAP
ncbi:MAG TPA: DsbA family protein [Longimicrobium sp.]|nr:DsbA family protein [Longimicrobium sp.]